MKSQSKKILPIVLTGIGISCATTICVNIFGNKSIQSYPYATSINSENDETTKTTNEVTLQPVNLSNQKNTELKWDSSDICNDGDLLPLLEIELDTNKLSNLMEFKENKIILSQSDKKYNLSSSIGRDSLNNLDNGYNKIKVYDKILNYLQIVHYNKYNIECNELDNNYVMQYINIEEYNINNDDLNTIYQCLKNDNPELFWLDNQYYIYKESDDNIKFFAPIALKQFKNSSLINEMKLKVEAKIQEYLSIMPKVNDEYEKELFIYEKLVSETNYDCNTQITNQNINKHNISGVLINNLGVSESYAKTMQLLLNAANIENIYVTGINGFGPHAWNQVKINGKYYNLDCALNDSPYYAEKLDSISYKYFNMSDDDFATSHESDSSDRSTGTKTTYLYDTMECVSDDSSYYTKNSDLVYTKNDDSNEKIKEFVLEKINESLENDEFQIKLAGEDNELALRLWRYVDSNKSYFVENCSSNVQIEGLEISYPGELKEVQVVLKPKEEVLVEEINIEKEIYFTKLNDKYYLKPEIKPSNATNKSDITWYSKDKNVAIVEDGVLTPVGEGETTIIAVAGEVSVECNVFVKLPNDEISSQKIDKDNLQKLYTLSKEKIQESYSEDSWSLFSDAREQAKQLLGKADITQEQINNCIVELQYSINNLVEEVEVPAVDKTNLKILCNKYINETNEKYTSETWVIFNDARNTALNVLNKEDASKKEVDEITQILIDAFANLKLNTIE